MPILRKILLIGNLWTSWLDLRVFPISQISDFYLQSHDELLFLSLKIVNSVIFNDLRTFNHHVLIINLGRRMLLLLKHLLLLHVLVN